MKQTFSRNRSVGFAIVEVVLGVIVIGLLAVVGIIFWQRSQSATTANTATTTSSSTVQPAPVGTTANIDQITTQDAETETSVDSSADGTVEQDAVSADNTISNVGGAYNESNL